VILVNVGVLKPPYIAPQQVTLPDCVMAQKPAALKLGLEVIGLPKDCKATTFDKPLTVFGL
jgi:hypothetical protein